MILTECPTSEALQLHASGQGEPSEENQLWEHVSHCATCQEHLETLREEDDSFLGPLREPQDDNPFEAESSCRLAVLKALGALAGNDPNTPVDSQDHERNAETESDMIPRVIGEYEIVRPIGQGGMGRVYLARHTKLGREVALKLLVGHRLADPRMRQRFDAEMRAVGKLRHPNIVTAHDARNVDGTAVLITEYIDGLDLMQLVGRIGPLSVAEACEIIRQVAGALESIREQGFVHRDIKPSNVMLSRHGDVKLLDLGLARFLHADEAAAMTGTGQTMGTADFVAPEQVTDSRSVDIRADVYSLGCTLFHLLTGAAPFADDRHTTTFAKLTAHVSEPPPKLAHSRPGVPITLAELVDSMLSKRPDQRPATPAIVAERLAEHTLGHDLRRLAERADTATSANSSANSPATTTIAATAKPAGSTLLATEAGWRKRVPLSFAIAAGLFGMLIGFALGIVITIKRPDGSLLSITVPAGSDIDIRPSGDTISGRRDLGVMGTGGPANGTMGMESMDRMGMDMGMGMVDMDRMEGTPSAPAMSGDGIGATIEEVELPAGDAPPLMFAILMNPDEVTADELTTAKRQLTRSFAGNSIHSDVGFWLAVAEGVAVPIEHTRDGQRYTLIKPGNLNLVPWEELQHNLTIDDLPRNTAAGEADSGVNLRFSGHMPQRMRAFTSQHRGRQLAVIAWGTILAAPRILAEIGDSARLTGNLTSEDFNRWQSARAKAVPPQLNVDIQGLNPFQARLKQIGVALHQYADSFGKLPGSSNVISYGRTTPTSHPFSWRVAILPLVGEQALYDEYRFDEPWDSEHNRTLLAKMPKIYQPLRSPVDDPFGSGETLEFVPTPPGETHLQGFVGPDTALGEGYGQRFHDMTDGTSNTLLLIESRASVPWTKPADLPFKSPEDANAIRPLPERPLHLLMVDGSVRMMQTPDPNVLTLMILRNDGTPFELE